jgi:hypothetical protein
MGVLVSPLTGGAQTVRLQATADIWGSSFQGEEGFSAGKHPFFKLKTIQELALVRFDAAPALGREVLRARLLLRRAGKDKLRYIRVSTVNADWEEGTRRDRLGPGDGATYNHADGPTRRAWAWPGSQLCDVIMGSGNTLTTWAERRELADGWISVDLTAELIHALAIGDRAVGGNALLAPGDRFGVPVVADLRLKAFRDGEQVCEYLKLVADRYHLKAEQFERYLKSGSGHAFAQRHLW